ncbi:hypothetical protein KUF71_000792 [Frankliniella fusca]|uniref:Uncharacterized protein n=1 Tax=Frankliniella fusca TaxID=407009 RepID=A0AAE1H7D1_9NEOP|nr:hypothetical protein KUF71_000792 [Frankliniella fusca]
MLNDNLLKSRTIFACGATKVFLSAVIVLKEKKGAKTKWQLEFLSPQRNDASNQCVAPTTLVERKENVYSMFVPQQINSSEFDTEGRRVLTAIDLYSLFCCANLIQSRLFHHLFKTFV